MVVMEGVIAVDKPWGWTSFAVVRWVRRHYKVRKAGHAGTLDPLATGLLLVATDAATRKIAEMQVWEKEYYALLRMGFETLSGDAEYPPQPVKPSPMLSPAERRAILARFEGCVWQRPPAFSALKVGGRRAYALARAGEIPNLPPRPVQIYQIQEVFYERERWLLRVRCGKGVYLRSLAQDIGQAVGCGAYLGALRRTRIGPYTIDQAIQPDALTRPH